MTDVTQILNAIEQGDPAASDILLPLVYDELRVLARQRLSSEQPGQTLQATALVHEAYLRLVGKNANDESWDNRGHFFAAAAEAMRRILINRARDKSRLKRGGDRRKIDFDEIQYALESDPDDLIDLNEAIDVLAEQDPIVAKLITLRFFAGLGQTEAAKCLNIPKSTADRYWSFGRVWLFNRLRTQTLSSE